MIQEEYVSLETAKLLKEVDFPQGSEGKRCFSGGQELHKDVPSYGDWVRVPTQSIAMRWLREKHGVVFEIMPNPNLTQWKCFIYFYPQYITNKQVAETWNEIGYSFVSYEQACECGIAAACKYLLKHKVTQEQILQNGN